MKKTLSKILSRLPLLRTLTHRVPPYYVGGVLENRLGWQLARILLSPKTHYPSSVLVPELAPHFEEIKQTGITVIPNFLPENEAEEIRAEAKTIESNMQFQGLRRNHMIGYMEQACHTVPRSNPNSPAWRYLGANPLVSKLATFTLGQEISAPDRIDFDFYRSISDPKAETNDIDAILHSDLHLDTVKIWYLLPDVTPENGPFVYAKGSHRRTKVRLQHEYRKSIDNALLRTQRWERISPSRLTSRCEMKRVKLSDEDRQKLSIEETPITGPAGALIVANTFGFHCRGKFAPGQTRKWIQLGFRSYNRGLS